MEKRGEKEPFAMRFDPDLLAWARSRAKGLRRTVTSVIEEALEEYRSKRHPKAQKSKNPLE